MKKKNYQNILFIYTILFFIVGVINISFAIVGLICFITPFVLYAIYKEKVWCKYFCPRAGFFNKVISKISFKRKIPKWITRKILKDAFLVYFGTNIILIIMSTIMVALGRMYPLDEVRFFILFRLPFDLPQLLDITSTNSLIHLGYRVYSLMLTSTTIGIILGIIYKPRTWCIICPVQTLTTKKK